MIQRVDLLWLSLCIISVATNPIQVIPQPCPICPYNEQNLHTHQQTNKHNQYPQPAQQNVAPSLDGLNQALINKIMSNPCMQKILDPNIRLVTQNGQEIQRQPNTATPNIVNNYFILPPEFFSPNDTKQKEDKPKKKRKNGPNQPKIKTQSDFEDVDDALVLVDKEPRRNTKHTSRNVKGKKKRIKNKNSDKVSQRLVDSEERKDENDNKLTEENDTTRKARKRARNKNTVSTQPSTYDPVKYFGNEVVQDGKKNKKKKKMQRKKSKPVNNNFEEIKEANNDEIIVGNSKKCEGSHCLKNIESPLDDAEVTNDLIENRLQARNSKNNRYEEDLLQQIQPVPDDFIKSFYPYMNLNNFYNSHMNYPFDFRNIYQPLYGKHNRKIKTRKNKNKQNIKDVGDSPHVIEVKLKPKHEKKSDDIQQIFTEVPTEVYYDTEDNEEESEYSNPHLSEDIEVTEIPMEIPQEISPPKEEVEVNLENLVTQTETVETEPMETLDKIEDLHEYLTPELDREHIVPTTYIKDYYPIFYDDTFYASNENDQIEDLDDDRLFYNTDRNQDDSYNRNRRKYDNYLHIPHNIKDRINFRRGFLKKENIKAEKNVDEPFMQKPNPNDYVVFKPELMPSVNEKVADEFKMPPLLENPDFKSTQIEKGSRVDNYDAPYYIPEKASEVPITPAFSRVVDDFSLDPPANMNKDHSYVETVFAKSRVVKYGVPDKIDETHADVNDAGATYPSDGQTTFVVAKSLGPVEDYY